MKKTLEMMGLGFVGLAEDIFIIFSLGFFVPGLRAWYLFDFLGEK